MKASLLDKDHPLKDSKKNSESRSIARTITLTTLTQLNSEQDQQKAKEGKYNQRKGLIMQFLYESGLIKLDPKADSIISLNTADLTFANLYDANLESARLYRANLESAYLNFAHLRSANLESTNLLGANLESANLERANLESANLYNANLKRANLKNADLKSANLRVAFLDSANLDSANLNNTENLTNKQIKLACFWEKAIYTEARREFDKDRDEFFWTATNKTANQRKIDEIKQDKASDPPNPPDCSKWKQNPFLKF
jgi:uncharacterized protein YjbI with pentapeptide repeats